MAVRYRPGVAINEIALVTGASSGIGEATALELKKCGYTVYEVARRVDRMTDLESQGIHTLSMAVTDEDSVTAGIQRIIADTGWIDVLVNSAGYGSYRSLEDMPLSEAK
jgi:NADP-dependent 3-hydroxy acid dehydrogenase YdfG